MLITQNGLESAESSKELSVEDIFNALIGALYVTRITGPATETDKLLIISFYDQVKRLGENPEIFYGKKSFPDLVIKDYLKDHKHIPIDGDLISMDLMFVSERVRNHKNVRMTQVTLTFENSSIEIVDFSPTFSRFMRHYVFEDKNP